MDEKLIYGAALGAFFSYFLLKTEPLWIRFFSWMFAYFVSTLPLKIKGYFRNKRLIKLNLFRKTRGDITAVTAQVIRSYSYYILFWLSIVFYINLLVFADLGSLFEKSFTLGIAVIAPIYIIEIVWLQSAQKANSLLKARSKLGL